LQPLAESLEEGHAEVFLEIGKRLAGGRLRQTQVLRGRADCAGARYGDENL